MYIRWNNNNKKISFYSFFSDSRLDCYIPICCKRNKASVYGYPVVTGFKGSVTVVQMKFRLISRVRVQAWTSWFPFEVQLSRFHISWYNIKPQTEKKKKKITPPNVINLFSYYIFTTHWINSAELVMAPTVAIMWALFGPNQH